MSETMNNMSVSAPMGDGKVLITRNKMYGDNNKPFNAVSNPIHYTAGGVSPLELIAAQLGPSGLRGFCLGNAIKYIARAGKKDPHREIEDLEKAIWYTQFWLEELKILRGDYNESSE